MAPEVRDYSNLITEPLRAGEAWAVRLFKHRELLLVIIRLFNIRRTGDLLAVAGYTLVYCGHPVLAAPGSRTAHYVTPTLALMLAGHISQRLLVLAAQPACHRRPNQRHGGVLAASKVE